MGLEVMHVWMCLGQGCECMHEHGFQVMCFQVKLRASLSGMDSLDHIKCEMFISLCWFVVDLAF